MGPAIPSSSSGRPATKSFDIELRMVSGELHKDIVDLRALHVRPFRLRHGHSLRNRSIQIASPRGIRQQTAFVQP